MKKIISSLALCSSLIVLPTISHAALGDKLLKEGMTDPDVKELQDVLKQKGIFSATSTGYFGSITKDSVLSFQRSHSLTADGMVGPNTYQALIANSTSAVTNGTLLKYGMTSNEVEKVQQLLKEKGYFNATPTGYFGTITQTAVMNFQRDHGLAVDGIVGPATLNALNNASTSTTGSSTVNSSTQATASDIVAYSKKFIGVPYVWGGTSPNGFDCSGFIYYVFKNGGGVTVPRTVATLYQSGKSTSTPNVGDIVFFDTTGGPSHAGIYIGNGQFIHAGSSTGVTIASLSNSYWAPRYLGSKSIL
ncbi:peptidoglycan-binding protein [Priestia sp. P5]|uniref:C40 family peptidase n=1 Tax=Priestia sp. P5 TaxID=2917806 RepID=UPI0024051D12|nr:peptidoglycan-binding protein [Priestia sp. P5]MDG0060219.1 peptidoglycan-binding protein [Priestia sp. P5]